jgi:hypothetical protein
MVFVSFLLGFSSLIFIIILATSNLIALKLAGVVIKLVNYTSRFTKQISFTNGLFIYILMLFIFLNNKTFWVITLLSFILMSYLQKNNWLVILEDKLIWTPLVVRKKSLERLLSDNCTITHFNFHLYVYDLLCSEWAQFVEMLKDSITDIKVFLYLVDPVWKLTARQRDLYNLQKKFFKYKTVEEFLKTPEFKSEEEVIKLYTKLKQSRDPRIAFNSVRRLPWKFSYSYDSNIFFKLIASNFLVIYNFFKTTIIAVVLMVVYFLYTIFFFKIQFLKQLSVWFVIGMIYFWLMSGFNFFLKRYQYGKFTSQIQRFWKRTNTCFWLIEGFLILLFFYYYLNSSQEPLYMYDYSALNQEFLVPLHAIGTNIILLSLVIYFMYFTLLRINSNSWTQLNVYLTIISSFIFFSFFIETYQFYYVVSTFNERLWVFNEEENLWSIDIENPILRTKHQYLLVCLIAKYWHFLFIFLSWVFFLIKSFERKKITYVLFGANLQNMIILYILNFACYLQWFKWIYRRFFDLPYTWFFINVDNKFLFRLFFEIKLFVLNFFNFNTNLSSFQTVVYKSLNLWNVDSLCMWKFL